MLIIITGRQNDKMWEHIFSTQLSSVNGVRFLELLFLSRRTELGLDVEMQQIEEHFLMGIGQILPRRMTCSLKFYRYCSIYYL